MRLFLDMDVGSMLWFVYRYCLFSFHNIKRSVHNILVSKQGTSSDIIAV